VEKMRRKTRRRRRKDDSGELTVSGWPKGEGGEGWRRAIRRMKKKRRKR
jgi:hypothetical protein